MRRDGDGDNAQVIQVIRTTLLRRGTGKDETSPIRGITQYWSLEGDLLAEVDPCAAATGRPVEAEVLGNVRWRGDAGQISYFPGGFDPNGSNNFSQYKWERLW